MEVKVEFFAKIVGSVAEEEVQRTVSRLKGGKAPGTCGIMPEMLKAGEVAIEWLVKLIE